MSASNFRSPSLLSKLSTYPTSAPSSLSAAYRVSCKCLFSPMIYDCRLAGSQIEWNSYMRPPTIRLLRKTLSRPSGLTVRLSRCSNYKLHADEQSAADWFAISENALDANAIQLEGQNKQLDEEADESDLLLTSRPGWIRWMLNSISQSVSWLVGRPVGRLGLPVVARAQWRAQP